MGPFSKAIDAAKLELKLAERSHKDWVKTHRNAPEESTWQRLLGEAGERLQGAKDSLADAIQAKRDAGHGPFSRK